jgi:N-methylhydantoinase A
LSAYGGLICDVRWEEAATLHETHTDFDLERTNTLIDRLRSRGREFLDRAGFPRDKQRFEYAYQGRYLYQSWDIEVPFALPGNRLTPADISRLAAAFHQMHERIYTIKDENDVVEFTTWKVRAVGDTGGAGRRGVDLPKQSGTLTPKSRRKVYLGPKQGFVELPVYQGDGLGSGARIEGPAIVEEPTTTILLLKGQTAVTDPHRNYLVELTT